MNVDHQLQTSVKKHPLLWIGTGIDMMYANTADDQSLQVCFPPLWNTSTTMPIGNVGLSHWNSSMTKPTSKHFKNFTSTTYDTKREREREEAQDVTSFSQYTERQVFVGDDDDDDNIVWTMLEIGAKYAPRGVSDKHKKVIMKKCVLFNPKRLVKWITLNYWAKFIFIQMTKNNYPQTWIINIWSPAFVVDTPTGLLSVISQMTVREHTNLNFPLNKLNDN